MKPLLTYLASVNWAIWLGIAALVLMYPVAFIANVTTPILQDWWSSRSRRSMEKRLKHLVDWQVRLNNKPVDHSAALILTAIQQLIVTITYGSTLILGVLIRLGADLFHKHPSIAAYGFVALDGGICLSSLYVVGRLRAWVSPDYRDGLDKRIERLQARIKRMDQREARQALVR